MRNKNKNLNSVDPIMVEKEKALIVIMQTGTEAQKNKAFVELYKNRKTGLFNKLKLQLKFNEEDAEDLTQEVFTKVWLNISQYNGSTNFTTWLYAIAKNALIDHIRRQKHEIIRMDSMKPTLDDGADSFKDRSFQIPDAAQRDGLSQIAAKEHSDLVHAAIANIKKDVMRDIIRMKYIEQMSGNEICAKLNMPVGTFKANNFRAEKLVKDFILSTGFDPTPFIGQKNKKAVEVDELD